jgi:hypothetical protein
LCDHPRIASGGLDVKCSPGCDDFAARIEEKTANASQDGLILDEIL